jgi:hypothetical protein
LAGFAFAAVTFVLDFVAGAFFTVAAFLDTSFLTFVAVLAVVFGFLAGAFFVALVFLAAGVLLAGFLF